MSSSANATTTAHELRTADRAKVAGLLRTVPGATTVAFIMHPRQDVSHHPLVPELLARGWAVWTQGSRSQGNDLALLHEQALLDMAAGQMFLRERGFENVVCIGHSGGATLAAFYFEQAIQPSGGRLKQAPGGQPVALADADMPLPDGLVLLAPHPGQGVLLERVIDPSVLDEADPLSVDPELDPWSAMNGFMPPPTSSNYSQEFVDRYRRGQRDRVAKIDAFARERIGVASNSKAYFAASNDPQDERASVATGVMTVHRTDADLRSVDLSIDPNNRRYGSLFGPRPDLSDFGVAGFGRLATPEAWLSTWSSISSNANLARNLKAVTVPTLIVEFTGDQACFPADIAAFTAACSATDVENVSIAGQHFGAPIHRGETSGTQLAGSAMSNWMGERFPTGAFVSM
ncbi:alpha/beta hydrolase [Subtercola lobariae]|uniref:Alpha/beta hydrolase n=1 Tax=Subtercola lobariae TaxID=1588641 RepID=A0A917BBC7_9MICO|nr:alpha/beta hydrolase [Subtercola lobariae]GGF33986.1 alpha/beta hydrolase [Subtercola lobariae]